MATSSGLALRPDLVANLKRRGIEPPSADTNGLALPWRYYDRQNVPVNGAQVFSFFGSQGGPEVTNFPPSGQMPANNVFEVHAICFSFFAGLDRLGRRLGLPAPTQAQVEASRISASGVSATAGTDPLAAQALWGEKIRELLSQGALSIKVASQVFTEGFGLTSYPDGRGVVTDGSIAAGVATTATTTSNLLVHSRTGYHNGIPSINNIFRLPAKFALFPNVSFKVDVNYARSVDFAQQFAGPLNGVTGAEVAGTLECNLVGVLYRTSV